MKKSIYIIIFIIAGCLITSIGFLYLNTTKRNGFDRQVVNINFKTDVVIPLHSKSIFIGGTSNEILIKNFINPIELLIFKLHKKQLCRRQILMPSNFDLKSNYINQTFLNDYFFVSNTKGQILRFSNTDNTPTIYRQSLLFFDQACAISDRSLIVRSKIITGGLKQRVLNKLEPGNKDFKIISRVISDQSEEVFSSDGWLHFNSDYSILFYMHYYTGKIIAMDTNLNIKYEAKTIDTVKVATIASKTIVSKTKGNGMLKSTTTINPNALVNKYITSFQSNLYVYSKLTADNENIPFLSQKRHIIDVYSIQKGTYVYSFYLPNHKDKPLNSFLVSNNLIAAIYGTDLLVYTFKNVGL